MKIFNIKGIIIAAVIFTVVQVVVAMVISPILKPIVIEAINKNSDAKISIEKVTVWPLTLSCSLKDLKIFDPDDQKERIALVKSASVKISPLGLLSKRLIVSRLSVAGAEINLKGEPDGSFNVQKLARPKDEKKSASKTGVFGGIKGKKDWFGRIFEMIKKKSQKGSVEKEAAEQKASGSLTREVEELPHGKRVRFVSPGDRYVFQIRDLTIKNSSVKLDNGSGLTVDVENAALYVKNLGLDPVAGARFDKLGAKGALRKGDAPAGSFDLDYSQSFKRGSQTQTADLSAKDIDLAAVAFIYEDSLPVEFTKGTLSLHSSARIVDGNLDSSFSLTMKDHAVRSSNNSQMVGVLPLPMVCEALNKVDPVVMNFKITGTVDRPQFEGFQKILLDLVKPYAANVTENIKKEGLKAIGNMFKKDPSSPQEGASSEDAASNVAGSLKSIFGGQKE
ncbi:MAG: AsmA family protein [Candidatus Omnitrophota bacterium]